MKFFKKHIVYEILGALFTFASVNSTPLSSHFKKGKSEEVIEGAHLILNPANHYTNSRGKIHTVFPSSFDLRDVDGLNFISPVKNQGLWGTCWSFGSLAAAEASAQYELWKEYGITPNEMLLDFSELQLGWFAYTALQKEDPDYPAQSNEGIYFDDGVDILNMGGYNDIAISLLAAGVGPWDEKEIPYINKSGNILWERKGKNGSKEYQVHPENWEAPDGFEPVAYETRNEDWSVDMKNRFKSKLRLEHANKLPSPAIRDDYDRYHFDQNGIDAIKYELLSGKAVEVSFHADSAGFDDLEKPPVFLSKNYAHYTYDEEAYPNHSVCIVGYDDNYPASNFIQTMNRRNVSPPGNGAFIVKNSWGHKNDAKLYSDWGIDGSGYFYLSYYDKSIADPTSYDFAVVDLMNNDFIRTIDQHDLVSAGDWNVYGGDSTVFAMSNVFKSEKKEVVDGVSAYVFIPETTVEYEVYKLNNNYTNPIDGTLAASGSQRIQYSGFHLFDLETPVEIAPSEAYSIVIRQKDKKNNYYFGFSLNFNKNFHDTYNRIAGYNNKLDYYYTSIVNKGESYIFSEEEKEWIDETQLAPLYSTYRGSHPLYRYREFVVKNALDLDNFPIKGYAKMEKPNSTN